MGRPKIKIIDDSAPEAEEKEKKVKSSDKPEISESAAANETKTASPEVKTETKKPQKPGKEKPRSKKYQELTKDLDRNKNYPLNEAIETVKKLSYSKFEGSLEAHINTATTGIRGLVSLPFASGRKLRIIAFGNGAETSGADTAGTEDTIESINKGKIDFDIVVTTPAWMSKLAKVARILGPRGLMPNPKNGTITDDLKRSVEGFQAGKTEYKTESKAPVIHMALGKINQPTEELSANIKTLLQTLGKTRVKKVTLSPTMGPSVKLDLSSI
ncbi:50S ribosomal protein L1 [Candidatus Daviesbacteria bacterium]|nr:50S ribosomal protein L1 [Candidatus Daviesbacteria bacterium]